MHGRFRPTMYYIHTIRSRVQMTRLTNVQEYSRRNNISNTQFVTHDNGVESQMRIGNMVNSGMIDFINVIFIYRLECFK
jgi:hypothetical protein